jgi:hypothetical protein
VDLDFKEDQLAIEAHVRMRSGWRDMDEISPQEWFHYAMEYIVANPIFDGVIKLPREEITYDRLSVEFTSWKRIQHTEIYWERVAFGYGMYISIYSLLIRHGLIRGRSYLEPREPSTLRKLGEYFGLIEEYSREAPDWD